MLGKMTIAIKSISMDSNYISISIIAYNIISLIYPN